MSRWCVALLLAGLACAQPPEQKKSEDIQLPPEEDAAAAPEQYSFNPVKSKRDVEVGNLYFKKGDYKGAASRYETAVKWNDGNADAWLRLAETREKQQNVKGAREAYERFLQLAPDGKNASEARKRLEKLK